MVSLTACSVFSVLGLASGSLAFAMNEQSGMKGNSDLSSHELLLNANSLIGTTVIDKSGKIWAPSKTYLLIRKQGKLPISSSSMAVPLSTVGINQENYSIAWREVVLTKKDDGMVVEVAETAIGETSSKAATTSERHDRKLFRSGKPETVEGRKYR